MTKWPESVTGLCRRHHICHHLPGSLWRYQTLSMIRVSAFPFRIDCSDLTSGQIYHKYRNIFFLPPVDPSGVVRVIPGHIVQVGMKKCTTTPERLTKFCIRAALYKNNSGQFSGTRVQEVTSQRSWNFEVNASIQETFFYWILAATQDRGPDRCLFWDRAPR